MRVEAKTADKKIQRLQDSNDHKAQELGDLQIKASNCSLWWPFGWWHGKPQLPHVHAMISASPALQQWPLQHPCLCC
jgi:hypothetical protein